MARRRHIIRPACPERRRHPNGAAAAIESTIPRNRRRRVAPMSQTQGAFAANTSRGNEFRLFSASFLTLIAAGIGFSVRGGLLSSWGAQFGFTQSELGGITGFGLVGFGFTIIFFSFFADLV